jgi:hypothetical protein
VIISPNVGGTMVQGDQYWRKVAVEEREVEVVEGV